MTSATYVARFREILRDMAWPATTTPAALLDRWIATVAAAEEGYQWTIDEYLNELAARDVLEAVFSDAALASEPEVEELRARVADADDRLRAIIQDNVEIGSPEQPWWRRGVLRHAGADYVEDLERIYGIRVLSV